MVVFICVVVVAVVTLGWWARRRNRLESVSKALGPVMIAAIALIAPRPVMHAVLYFAAIPLAGQAILTPTGNQDRHLKREEAPLLDGPSPEYPEATLLLDDGGR
jgi:uncharacterized membrane protein YwaF